MKKYRIAVGGFSFEANTFSSVVVYEETFRRVWECLGDDMLTRAPQGGVETGGAISVLQTCDDVEILPLIDVAAGAGGRIAQSTYLHYQRILLERLDMAGPVDAVFLALHGAAIAQEEADVDGALIMAVRQRIGPETPLVVTLDLHGTIKPRMMTGADVIIGYEHYPHEDVFETGQRAARLLIRQLRGEIKPCMAALKLPMLVACQNQGTRIGGPMTELYALARDLEAQENMLSASYFTVQHGIDHPSTCLSVVAISDDDPALADHAAHTMADFLWQNRHRFLVDTVEPEQAIALGLETGAAPVVLSEASDTVGGGAFGDSATMLEALLNHAPDATGCLLITDPQTVEEADRIGVGNSFEAQIGNKLSPGYGSPVKAKAEVIALTDGTFSYESGWLSDMPSSMGRTAHLKVGNLDVVLCSEPTYENAAEQFQSLGIDPWQRKFVVVRNPMNFQKYYATAPLRLHLDTAGPTTCAINETDWTRLRRPIFPLDDGFTPEFTNLRS